MQKAIEETCSIRQTEQILSTTPNFQTTISPEAPATLSSLGIKHGDMLHLKQTEIEPEFKLFSRGEGEKEEAPSPKQKRGKKRASVFTSEGNDADEVARSFLCAEDEAANGKNKLGYAAHCQFAAAARMAAACRCSVELNQKSVGKNGDKFKLLVEYSKNARSKPVSEQMPFYSKEHIVAVFGSILRKSTTSKRRKASTHMLNEVEIAMRSPPLYWSIYYYTMDQAIRSEEGNGTNEAKPVAMESAIAQLMNEAAEAEGAGAKSSSEPLTFLP
jgi:hypothetical protein